MISKNTTSITHTGCRRR